MARLKLILIDDGLVVLCLRSSWREALARRKKSKPVISCRPIKLSSPIEHQILLETSQPLQHHTRNWMVKALDYFRYDLVQNDTNNGAGSRCSLGE